MKVTAICRVLMLELFISTQPVHSQASPTETIHTPSPVRIEAIRSTGALVIDGILNESILQRPGFSDFKQREPNQGALPTERTEVWVAYDDAALYVAARMSDSAPDSIMRILSRRDRMLTADWFGVFVDPYYDRRTGYFFALSAAGTLADGVLYNDDWDDNSWDGVWEGKTSIDEKGWSAEFRIPFSQLRFHQQEKYLWAINFRRDIGRKNETDYLVYKPRNESGFVSRFLDLVGIENVQPSRQLEVLPYVNTRAEYTKHPPGDPFNNGSKFIHGVGVDLKLGLSPNLTLDATVNPDFGQVEVDPAVVNLSDVETFFQEKRPFFIEGASIFNFGRGGANNYWNFNFPSVTHFYSRRIGRAPQGSRPWADYVDAPLGTRILGAGKISGKLGGGWNVGVIQAVTAREHADTQTAGNRSRWEIEPASYYGIARTQKEFNEGRQAIGMLTTYTRRFFDDERLRDEINSDALFTGIDGFSFLDAEKMWVVTGWAGLSHVAGNSTRVTNLQRNSRHYFQQPDASHVRVDSSATSLTGYAARVWINKQKGNVFSNSAIGIIDPKFDVNDAGLLSRADVINWHSGVGYQWTEPTSWYRRLELGASLFQNLDFDGNITWQGIFHFGFLRFPNYWGMNWNYAYNPQTVSNRQTRGGPLMRTLPGRQFSLGFFSDDRKSWVVEVFSNVYSRTGETSVYSEVGVEWKPAPNVNLSVGPNLSVDQTAAQWIEAFNDPMATSTYGSRYVFGYLNQRTVGASIRLNWTFTPELSLQLYAQPLISAGRYSDLKELAQPKTFDFVRYGKDNGSSISEQRDANGNLLSYVVDPDGSGPAKPITISNPDFNIKSLRGNAVLRWEYRLGSILYVVWTQSRSDYENVGEFEFNRSWSKLWDSQPDNIFMLKFTYWLNM